MHSASGLFRESRYPRQAIASKGRRWLWFGLIGVIGLAIALSYYTLAQVNDLSPQWLNTAAFSARVQAFIPQPVATTARPGLISLQDEIPKPSKSLGHYLYAPAPLDQLMIIGSYAQGGEQRFERLRREAGLAFLKMVDAARLDGVWIIPVSGFRSLADQTELFQLQIQQNGSEALAAKAVAPPGYSEHHTGYAIDLGDGSTLRDDVSLTFEESNAFQWLTDHAAAFGFELSFPQGNKQGVNYEPWHWRYVASPEAAQIFSVARRAAKSTG
jgi:D-alanyl-D-alanine carboxypeptidase